MKRCPFTRKVKYGSKADALGWAEDYRWRFNGPKDLSAYYCYQCGSWHLTKRLDVAVEGYFRRREGLDRSPKATKKITSVFWENQLQRENVGNHAYITLIQGKMSPLESLLIERAVAPMTHEKARPLSGRKRAGMRARPRQGTKETQMTVYIKGFPPIPPPALRNKTNEMVSALSELEDLCPCVLETIPNHGVKKELEERGFRVDWDEVHRRMSGTLPQSRSFKTFLFRTQEEADAFALGIREGIAGENDPLDFTDMIICATREDECEPEYKVKVEVYKA